MTRTTAARVAGFTFLFYIVVGISSMAGVFRGPSRELATYPQNASAVILALTMFVVTRVEQPLVAALAMIFRLAEGALGPALELTGMTLSKPTLVGANLFAVGSMFFCWLLLAAIGLYGVVSCTVGQRTRELGLRMALGARPLDILHLVLSGGLGTVAIGLGVGLFAGFALARFLGTLLFDVNASDPAAIAGTVFTLAVVALAAHWVPVRRALRVDPVVALRQE